jgi:hypothetical protein
VRASRYEAETKDVAINKLGNDLGECSLNKIINHERYYHLLSN